MAGQPSLFPLRITTIYPGGVNGADIRYMCETDHGGPYYCKGDKDGRLVRATEWFFTQLARHLNITTPDCAILEDPQSAETLFGSLQVTSTASLFEVRRFLSASRTGELGQPSEWPGAYLSALYAIDLFFGNGDRDYHNFLLQQEGLSRRLCAFDFAAGNIHGLARKNFQVSASPARLLSAGRIRDDRSACCGSG
jgi:hypothetical protein